MGLLVGVNRNWVVCHSPFCMACRWSYRCPKFWGWDPVAPACNDEKNQEKSSKAAAPRTFADGHLATSYYKKPSGSRGRARRALTKRVYIIRDGCLTSRCMVHLERNPVFRRQQQTSHVRNLEGQVYPCWHYLWTIGSTGQHDRCQRHDLGNQPREKNTTLLLGRYRVDSVIQSGFFVRNFFVRN